ncbi:TCR/Tet family MFS transporter [Mesobacterium sp. TK19101]|uniref:TCR/Tet family MFS transporter n=1 Tax=Mesobacterium hydrothermale TaxID=3111907 RepID=A0ABU6HLN4_9RHOB|nr:TCR/Tet family MFS transporter [Mesobacterium sp. TK19101]MEC3863276.1 TCR/Tet family MFS transporter [Mesobacterium sp. TK19101]
MRLPVLFVLATVMIDAMGIGLIMPVMPDLIQEVTDGTLGSAALWGGVLATSFAVMQFLFGPAVGALSDRFGRRPVLLVSMAVMAADYLVMAVAGTMWLLLVARIIGGIAGATQSTASAFMADISAPGKKAQNFGLVGAAFGLGFVAGPLIGGLLGELGTRAPFLAAAGLSALNFVLGLIVLPETVTDATRRPFDPRRAHPFGAFRALARLPGVRKGLLVFFICQVAVQVYPAVWAFYGKARFDWNAGTIGLTLGLFGLTMALVQGLLIRVILRVLGERGTVIYGLALNIATFLLIAFVPNGTWALVLTPVAALGGVINPALQGQLSARVGDDSQGALQGLLTSAGALSMILSPLLMTGSFALGTDPRLGLNLPAAPFLLAAVLTVLALAAFVLPRRHSVA